MSKALYIGDNGRMTCSDLKCAGMTAYYSKMQRDLSGQAMERLTTADVREFQGMGIAPACEGCGASASVLV